MDFQIRSSTYLKVALAALVLLIVADLAGIYSTFVLGHPSAFGVIPRFRMDFESNVPTALSALNILFAALLLGGLAREARPVSRADSRAWGVLCLVIGFLALDELATVHELVNHAVSSRQGGDGGFAKLWVLPYAAFAAFVGIVSIRLLLRLPAHTRRNMVIAGLLFVTGAAGIEGVAGRYLEEQGGNQNLVYALMTTLEETLEILGMTLFAWTLLRHIESTGVRVALSAGAPRAGNPD